MHIIKGVCSSSPASVGHVRLLSHLRPRAAMYLAANMDRSNNNVPCNSLHDYRVRYCNAVVVGLIRVRIACELLPPSSAPRRLKSGYRGASQTFMMSLGQLMATTLRCSLFYWLVQILMVVLQLAFARACIMLDRSTRFVTDGCS